MWKVCLPLLLFFVTVVVGQKLMPKTGGTHSRIKTHQRCRKCLR
jgi:hypothetical protein